MTTNRDEAKAARAAMDERQNTLFRLDPKRLLKLGQDTLRGVPLPQCVAVGKIVGDWLSDSANVGRDPRSGKAIFNKHRLWDDVRGAIVGTSPNGRPLKLSQAIPHVGGGAGEAVAHLANAMLATAARRRALVEELNGLNAIACYLATSYEDLVRELEEAHRWAEQTHQHVDQADALRKGAA